jgi:hypothetical protein
VADTGAQRFRSRVAKLVTRASSAAAEGKRGEAVGESRGAGFRSSVAERGERRREAGRSARGRAAAAERAKRRGGALRRSEQSDGAEQSGTFWSLREKGEGEWLTGGSRSSADQGEKAKRRAGWGDGELGCGGWWAGPRSWKGKGKRCWACLGCGQRGFRGIRVRVLI